MPQIYVVRSGDTMHGISTRFGTSLNALLAINPHISDPDIIHVGQSINIPSQNGSNGTLDAPGNGAAGDCPWFSIAQNELGETEIAGSEHNPKIIEYHDSTSLKATDDETPWCSSFVNWCIEKSGRQGTDSAAARSWLQWGEKISHPRKGCIVIFSRPPHSWTGHVGFFDSLQGNHILVLGGNQKNAVNYSSYSDSRLLGYRWPAS